VLSLVRSGKPVFYLILKTININYIEYNNIHVCRNKKRCSIRPIILTGNLIQFHPVLIRVHEHMISPWCQALLFRMNKSSLGMSRIDEAIPWDDCPYAKSNANTFVRARAPSVDPSTLGAKTLYELPSLKYCYNLILTAGHMI